MVGGPPGETAPAVDEVEVEGEAVVGVVVDWSCGLASHCAGEAVVGVRAGGVPVCGALAAVRDGGEEPLSETTNAIAAATTSAATRTTEPMSQRFAGLGFAGLGRRPASVAGSCRVSSRRGAPSRGWAPSRIRTSPTRRTPADVRSPPLGWTPCSGWTISAGAVRVADVATGSGGGVTGVPADSRARRTALSIAPRARWPGVPGGGSTACSSAIGSSDARSSSLNGLFHSHVTSSLELDLLSRRQ